MKTFASWESDYVKIDVKNVKHLSELNSRYLFSQISAAVK